MQLSKFQEVAAILLVAMATRGLLWQPGLHVLPADGPVGLSTGL